MTNFDVRDPRVTIKAMFAQNEGDDALLDETFDVIAALDVERLERAIWAYLRSPWYIDVNRGTDPADIAALAKDIAKEYEADDPDHQRDGWEVAA